MVFADLILSMKKYITLSSMASFHSFSSLILQHEILWNGSEEMMVLNGFFSKFFLP